MWKQWSCCLKIRSFPTLGSLSRKAHTSSQLAVKVRVQYFIVFNILWNNYNARCINFHGTYMYPFTVKHINYFIPTLSELMTYMEHHHEKFTTCKISPPWIWMIPQLWDILLAKAICWICFWMQTPWKIAFTCTCIVDTIRIIHSSEPKLDRLK